MRCVCKGEDKCNGMEKPGKSNRNSAAGSTFASLVLIPLALISQELINV